MQEQSEGILFPNWFNMLFIVIGIWSLSQELARPAEIIFNLIILLFYPLILISIFFLAKLKNISFGKGRYFFNISISIILFFAFIVFACYRNYIEYIGKLLGGEFSIHTDYSNIDYDEFGQPHAPDLVANEKGKSMIYYYGANVIYILIILYFVLVSWSLSNKIKLLTDKNEAEDQKKQTDWLNTLKVKN